MVPSDMVFFTLPIIKEILLTKIENENFPSTTDCATPFLSLSKSNILFFRTHSCPTKAIS